MARFVLEQDQQHSFRRVRQSSSVLRTVALQSNLITSLFIEYVCQLVQRLNILRIDDNPRLTRLVPGTFEGLSQLRNLTIQNNQIVTLDASSLSSVNNFTVVPPGTLDQPCQITHGGRCITDGSGPNNDYQNSESCTFTILRDSILTAPQFDIEHEADIVTIGDRRFSGSVGPRSIDVSIGTQISWASYSSDSLDDTNAGWTICAVSESTAGNPIFQAGALPQLELEPSRISEQRATATDSTQVYGSYNRTRWALGTTYTVLPPNVTAAHTRDAGSTTYANVSLSSITYSLAWIGQPPPGFFVDGSTGELLIRMPQTVLRQNRTATLLAHTSDAAPAVVHRFTFEMVPADVANARMVQTGQTVLAGQTNVSTMLNLTTISAQLHWDPEHFA